MIEVLVNRAFYVCLIVADVL